MTLEEQDLLAALKELLEASKSMTSGALPSAQDLERYHNAVIWAKRVIDRTER